LRWFIFIGGLYYLINFIDNSGQQNQPDLGGVDARDYMSMGISQRAITPLQNINSSSLKYQLDTNNPAKGYRDPLQVQSRLTNYFMQNERYAPDPMYSNEGIYVERGGANPNLLYNPINRDN